MKVFVILLLFTIGYVQCFGLLDLLFGGFGGRSKVHSCPFHRCRNVDKRRILIQRNQSPNFPFHHLQHLRGPNTGYSVIGTNVENQALINSYVNRPGAFLAYDSAYDPIYDPCVDCDGSGSGGEYCMWGKCYFERTVMIGQN